MKRIALLLLLWASAASGIVIRHDRDDSAYLALGAKYPAVGHLGGRVGCTLIAPQWVITAAHTIEESGPYDDLRVTFGSESYKVVKIILHPLRELEAVDTRGDMALLKLDRPVQGIAPVQLYEKDDELGKVITLVGRGETGNGMTGPQGERDHKVRAARNQIEWTDATSLIAEFDLPAEALDLEGTTGPGDSGGPALLEQDGKLYLLGVGCFSDGEHRREGSWYGTRNHYARVSVRRQWILDTIAADPPGTIAWSAPAKLEGKGWPGTPAGSAAAAFFQAYNSGDAKAVEKFYAELAAPRPNRTAAERARPILELFETYGPYDLKMWSADGPRRIRVLVYSKKAAQWRSVGLDLSADGKVERMMMEDEAPPA